MLSTKLNIETYSNMARYDLIYTKYCQMAFQSPSDGAPISLYQQSFGTHSQTKVSGDRQRETTHEVCCLAAKLAKSLLSCIYCDRNSVTTFLKTKSFMCIAVRSQSRQITLKALGSVRLWRIAKKLRPCNQTPLVIKF